jgi:hypothetical protein
VSEVDQQQGQSREPLLAVNDELLRLLVADDDRPEEVVAVPLDLVAFVGLTVGVEELARQVVEKFQYLTLLQAYSRW